MDSDYGRRSSESRTKLRDDRAAATLKKGNSPDLTLHAIGLG
jgi:hypothetical protein